MSDISNLSSSLSSTTCDVKYNWALNALDVLSSVRIFQDIANKVDAKDELYSTAGIYINRLVPMDTIVFLEFNEKDMRFDIVVCEPKDQEEKIKILVDELIEKQIFSKVVKNNAIEQLILQDHVEKIILHPLVTPLGVKGMFLGIIGSQDTEINEIAINTVSVVVQNLSSSLDTYFGKKLINNYNQHLEVVINYRTRELEEAKKLAEVANIAKSDFLASMSHELNTPFNIIFGYLDLMMEDLEGITQEDPRYSMIDDLKKISFATKNLNKMVTNIIYLSKLEAGRIQVNKLYFHLNEVTSVLMKTYEGRAKEHNNTLAVSINTAHEFIESDQQLFERAIDNILDNACKFTQNGNIHISIYDKIKDKQSYVVVEITDTGIGIAEKDVKILFSSFTQIDSGDSRHFEGLGLGLAITKRICSIIGAQLTVKSQVSKGATFSIILPVDIKYS